jgi:hypothetical protein
MQQRTSSPRTFQTAFPFLAAPLTGLTGVLLLPTLPDDPAGQLAGIAAHSGRWLVANLMLIASFLLFLPAMLTLATHLRPRAPRLGPIGAWVTAIGFLLHIAIIGFVLAQLPLARSEAEGAVAVAEQLFSSPAFVAPLVPMLLATCVGLVLVAVAIWRTKLASRWAAVALLMALVADFAGPEHIGGVEISGIGIFAFLALGLGTIGWQVATADPSGPDLAAHPRRQAGLTSAEPSIISDGDRNGPTSSSGRTG